ncbi:hypothetical protein TRFO_26178 [Tritrichomonas foetus]|uniref:Glycogen debranching enzyme C-terminal domain-containing protein n=1 Tax=Tritrichomonas foetus TaxID=1144522 RepID=A0A1J4K4L1_9EUKA|nr:hypothetical protein TRFO_26178 [Tritrichomonas foetus]|eukprot:OHT05906.1 hypothetical protein TRFO_26178 [Tritrichomonas foetus]
MELKCPDSINACNFSISGLIDPSGNILPKVYFNPPVLGESLHQIISFHFSLLYNDNYIPLSQFKVINSDFAWPIPSITYSLNKLTARCWSPISFNDIKTTSLPVIFVEFSSPKEFSIQLDIKSIEKFDGAEFSIFISSEEGPFEQKQLGQLFLHGKKQIIAFAIWHDNLYSANFYKNSNEMIQNIVYRELKHKTQQIEEYLPQLRVDKRILLNLELVPAFALTRIIKSGELLTMGYCELNQRDSFWTSFVHLILFKEAEIKMIDESCEGQLETGKIPTTLIPLIERKFDIDITAYFILRIVRFIRYYEFAETNSRQNNNPTITKNHHEHEGTHQHDDKNESLNMNETNSEGESVVDKRTMDLAEKWYPYAKKAINYLASLRDDKNVPFARDFWADWKDIKGINNRLYGPHFVLLTKAAVKEFNWLSKKIGENPLDIEINVEPLWNGEYYQDVMRDSTSDGRFHQDQMITELWNVCGKERYKSMLEKAEELENQFGLPETLPFYPDDFGYPIGEYHNGGIWPWLSFADAAARISAGYRKSGEKLLLTVANTDILSFGDLCSNEYHHGVTGHGGGNNIQGWNSCAILPFSLYSNDPRNHYSKLLQDMRK